MHLFLSAIASLVIVYYIYVKFSSRKYLGGFAWCLLLLGSLLNHTVIYANHNRMPVSGWGGGEEVWKDGVHSEMQESTKLKFLCDVHGWPKCRYSIGDVFIFTGVLLVFIAAVRRVTE